VFAFEIHRSIHTSYRRRAFEPAPGDFDSRGEPSAEILFCSILLHHKFFESTPRDYVDLHFLLRGVSRLDWARIERLLGNEALLGLARVKERLNFEFLGEERKWRDTLPPAPRRPGLRLAGASARRALEKPPPGRGALSKFCDAFMVFFVYDRLRVAREVFVNKYFRYVLPVKYLRFLFPSRRAPTRTPHVRNNGIPDRNGT
jgi:hypothetical protein